MSNLLKQPFDKEQALKELKATLTELEKEINAKLNPQKGLEEKEKQTIQSDERQAVVRPIKLAENTQRKPIRISI